MAERKVLYKANAEVLRAKRLARYHADIEASRAALKEWRQKNKELVRSYDATKYAKRKGAPGRFTAADIDFLMKAQRGLCAAGCGRSIKLKMHIDHITAVARGGSNNRDNLQLLCPLCNMQKHAKDPITFMQSRGFLI